VKDINIKQPSNKTLNKSNTTPGTTQKQHSNNTTTATAH